MPVTMRDVARQANVSIKTVSRVINNQGEISEATRQRVLAVIEELGYRPSKVARALVTQRSHTLGLVMSDMTENPFFPEVARGVIDAAQARGYNVFLCGVDFDSERSEIKELEILQSLADHAVDGIIVYPTHFSNETIKAFAANFHPLVAINPSFDHPKVGMIFLETGKGAKLAVDYLASKGHTAIGMIAGDVAPADNIRRVQGYRQALAGQGLPVLDRWIGFCPPHMEPGEKAAHKLLTENPEITAIFAYNDLLALGAIQACRCLGRRVPEDCAIVGFDDIMWAAKAVPPLTTIRVEKRALGQQATERLFEMLGKSGTVFPPCHIDVELVIRGSA